MENQRVRLSKQMLKNSLAELLADKSINRISIRELCEHAGINRTTFYKYYGSQYDLLNDMEEEILNDLENYLKEEEDDREDMWLLRMLTFINDHIILYRLLLNNNVDPQFPEKLFNLPSTREFVNGIIGDKCSPEEREYLHGFLISGGFDIVMRWMNRDQRETPEQFAAFVLGIFDHWVSK